MEIAEIKKTLSELKAELKQLESSTEAQQNLDKTFSEVNSRAELSAAFEKLQFQRSKIERLKFEIAFFEQKAEDYRLTIEPMEKKQSMQEQFSAKGKEIEDFGTKLQAGVEQSYKGLKLPKIENLYKMLEEAKIQYRQYLSLAENHFFSNVDIDQVSEYLTPIECRIYSTGIVGVSDHLTLKYGDGVEKYLECDLYGLLSVLPKLLAAQADRFSTAFEKASWRYDLKPLPKELDYE